MWMATETMKELIKIDLILKLYPVIKLFRQRKSEIAKLKVLRHLLPKKFKIVFPTRQL